MILVQIKDCRFQIGYSEEQANDLLDALVELLTREPMDEITVGSITARRVAQ